MSLKCWNNAMFYKWTFMFCLNLFGISMGMFMQSFYVVLPNMREKLDVSYEFMGQILAFRVIGNIVALVIIGVVYDSFPYLVNYLMVIETVLFSTCAFVMPWSGLLWLFILTFYFQTSAAEGLNNGGQLNILRLFPKNAVARMQMYHLGYGIGGVLSGLVAQPFLSGTRSHSRSQLTKYCSLQQRTSNSTNFSSLATTAPDDEATTAPKAPFEYIFVVVGCVAFVSALLFLLHNLFLKPPKSVFQVPKKRQSWIKTISPECLAPHLKPGKIRTIYTYTMITLLFLFYFFYLFQVTCFVSYIVVFATDPCKSYVMHPVKAALLHSSINASFLIARFINSFCMHLWPTTLMVVFVVLNAIFLFLLSLMANSTEWMLWFAVCAMRATNGPLYPAGTSFTDRYICVSGSVVSVAFLGTAIGSSAGSALGGRLLDRMPSIFIVYAAFVCSLLLLLVTFTIIGLGHVFGLRPRTSSIQQVESQQIQSQTLTTVSGTANTKNPDPYRVHSGYQTDTSKINIDAS